MQVAVSQTVDVPVGGTRIKPAEARSQSRRAPSVGLERVWDIAPTQGADLAVTLVPSDFTSEVTPRKRSEVIGRAVNVVIAALALLLLLPIMVLVAIAIKLTSRGPVFYSQMRVGLDRRNGRELSNERRRHDHGGKLFKMYKFRTMRTDAEIDGRAVWAKKRDPRVIFIGGFLRATRIDELPQLYNVLRGDMNIVGPRPERPTIFARLRDDIPEYRMRQLVKPGITGWAQINQSYDACLDDVRNKVKYDLEYLRRQGVVEDLRIMSMTLPIMLFRRGGW